MASTCTGTRTETRKETEKPQPWQGGDDVEVISIWIGKRFRELVGFLIV